MGLYPDCPGQRLSHEPFRNAYSCVLVTKALVRYAASTHCRMDMHPSWFVRQPRQAGVAPIPRGQ
jgi:hypothetical protein